MSLKHLLALAGLVTVAACQSPTEKAATASPTLLRQSLQAEGAKLTERLNLLERRRTALIEASASFGFLAGPARRWASHVGPYEEQLHQERVDNLVLLAWLRRMTSTENVEQFVMHQDAMREGAKLTERLNLVERRRTALIEASANLGILAGPVRRYVSRVGPYEEQLHQQRIDNLVVLARIRRMTGPEDVEQFVTRQDARRGETALAGRLRLFWRS